MKHARFKVVGGLVFFLLLAVVMDMHRMHEGVVLVAAPPVKYVTPQATEFSVSVPKGWKVGSMLGLKIPGRGDSVIQVPPGIKPGETFVFHLGDDSQAKGSMASTKLQPVHKIPESRNTLLKLEQKDLTSFKGMLTYERALRKTMGKIRHTWKTSKLEESEEPAMDTEHFIPAEVAPQAPGWDPKNPNGFPAQPPDEDNVNGVPGYTYATNGNDLEVEDEGEGYYQPKDPEHLEEYKKLLKYDCFAAPGKPWLDHANCAALVKRTHLYPNADMFRFSGAFGWNPPFPDGPTAKNAKGAEAPSANEYWNYGSDEDLASAASWDGKEYTETEGEETEEQ